MPAVPGVEHLEEIGRGGESVVYKGRHGAALVAVKVSRTPDAGDGVLRRQYRREAALLGTVHHPGVPEVHATGEMDGRPFLVRAYLEGRPLHEVFAAGRLAESRVLAIALDVCGALAAVHRQGLVHRDVTPANLVHGPDGRTRLIDFGLAALPLSEEAARAAGTFHYAAPEQTGLLKRPIDARSDLYALGAVLFEALAGQPPFLADSAAEVVRQHAAVPAPDVRSKRPNTSPAMAMIIARLLEKDPDDRYPSAESLRADLESVGALNETLHAGRPIVLARAGFEVDEPGPIVGREAEMTALATHWTESRRGRGRTLVLGGEPGMGKSRLLRRFLSTDDRSTVTLGVRLYARGAGTHGTAFAPLRRAISHAVSQIPPTGGAALNHLRAAAGDLVPLLAWFSPALAERLGATVPTFAAPELGERMADALLAFLQAWARTASGLVLVVDDAHRLDEATRHLVQRLSAGAPQQPVLVVLAVPTDTPALSWAPANAIGLTLGPLDVAAVTEYLGALLAVPRVDPALVTRLMTHSRGNPFALEQFVRALLDGGLLLPQWGEWTLDLVELNHVALPNDVMQLIVDRLLRLGPETRRVLDVAAVQGRRFRADLLAAVLAVPAEEVYEALGQAVDAWLVERDGDGAWGFVHERVQQTLLDGMSDSAQREWHQRTADSLLADGVPAMAEDLYAVARHAARGHRERQPERVFSLQFDAGRRALREFAPEEAWRLLVEARESAEAAGIDPPAALHHALGDAAARTGRLEDAQSHLEAALAATEDRQVRASIHGRLAEAALTRSEVSLAQAALDRGLEALGARTRPLGLLGVLGLLVRDALALRRRFTAPKPGAEVEILAQLLHFRTYAALFEMNPVALADAILRQRWAVRDLDPRHPAWILAECHRAVLEAVRGRAQPALRHARRAVAAAERMGDPQVVARAHIHEAWTVHFVGRSVEAAERAAECLKARGHWLDAFDYLNGCGDLAWNLYMRGYAAEALTWVERGLSYESHASPRANRILGNVFEGLGAPVLAALGRERESSEALTRVRERQAGQPPDRYRQAALAVCETAFYAERRELDAGFEASVAHFEALGLAPEETLLHFRLFYVAVARGRFEQWRQRPTDAAAAGRFEAALRHLKRAAHIPVLQLHVALLTAAAAILKQGSPAAALARAARLSRRADSPWGAHEVARLTAWSLQHTGPDAAVLREAHWAYQLAMDHGWLDRARSIQTELGLAHGVTGPFDGQGAPSLLLRRQRDALLEVALASATVLDPELQARRVLDETVRLLGAERAFLLGPHHGASEADTPLPTMGHLSLVVRAGRDAHGRELGAPTDLHTAVIDRVVLTHLPLVHGAGGPAEAAQTPDEPRVPRSALAAPLLLRDRLLGVVYADHRRARGIFTHDDAQILLAIAQHLAIALETARNTQLEVYRRIAANVPGLVFRLRRRADSRLRFEYVSEAARDLLGLAPDELLGDAQVVLTAFAPPDRETFVATLVESARQLTPWRWEGRTLDGRAWLEGVARPERQHGGDVIWDGLLTDVTARKTAEVEARALNTQLEHRVRVRTRELAAANKELEAFNYSVSHDLRSALRSVEGFTAMLREDFTDALGSDGREMLDRVGDAAQRMWKVLDALHDLSRLNRAEMHRDTVDLGALAREIVGELRRNDPQRTVVLAMQEALVTAADAALVRVVLENLLGNAWKFTARQPVAHIELGVRPTPDGRAWFVRDDGVGFDPKHADKLFAPFQRLHGREEFPGTGIGLFTVQRIIQRHGGRIWAEARPGGGATFWFTLRAPPATEPFDGTASIELTAPEEE
jgi:PAS domain S-box-containing protein